MNSMNRAILGWALFSTLLHILALTSTTFRLVHRLRTSRMWWDDYMVIIPLVMNTVYFASLWISTNAQLHGRTTIPHQGINSFWIEQFMFLSVTWSCRISIALTLARVFPAFHKARRTALFFAAMFLLCYLGCIFVLTFQCPRKDASWDKSVVSNCRKADSFFGAFLVVTCLDISSDTVLILFPIVTLWKVKLPQNLRRIIISAFSGSVLTMIAAIMYCLIRYAGLNLGPNTITITSLSCNIEAAVSLTVSNLLVIVTFFYRIFKRVHDLEGANVSPVISKTSSQVAEGLDGGRETSIGRVSILNTEDRPLSFTLILTQISQNVWSSIRLSEPPQLLSQNMSSVQSNIS